MASEKVVAHTHAGNCTHCGEDGVLLYSCSRCSGSKCENCLQGDARACPFCGVLWAHAAEFAAAQPAS